MIEKENITNLLATRDDGTVYHRESQTLEYKESFNFAGLAEYFRDFAAFANNKGGYIIFGVKDRPRRELLGISASSKDQFDKLDPEKITGFLLEDFSGNISWEHDVIEINHKTFGVFKILEAETKPIICKKDESGVIKNGEIYFRYGGRTQKIQYAELESIIMHRIERQTEQWMDLMKKIAKSGPQNAAVLDIEKGVIEKDKAQILVIDDELTKSIKWIKEGSFNEKAGAPALKLVGEVQPVDTVEIIKKERSNKLKDYPLSARELAEKIKEKSGISSNLVWRTIQENGIKSNPDYSSYNFRNKRQEEAYEQSGVIASGTPSIYKISAVDFIINIIRNEH